MFKKDKFTKSIPPIKFLPYPERLRTLQLPSLNYRRLRGDLLQCFKIINDIDFVEKSCVLQFNKNPTRGHNFKLKVEHSFKSIRANSYFVRIVNSWNNLPKSVVNCTNINDFKGLLDSFYKDKIYSY